MFDFIKSVNTSLNDLYEFLKQLSIKELFLSVLLSGFFAGIFLGSFSFLERTLLYGGSLSIFNKLKALCFSVGLLGFSGLFAGLLVFVLIYSLIFLYIRLCEFSIKGEKTQAYKVLILYSLFWAAVASYLFVYFMIENPSDMFVDIFRMNDIFTGGIYFLYVALALIILVLIIVFLKNAMKKKNEKEETSINPLYIKVFVVFMVIVSLYYLFSLTSNSWQVNALLNENFLVSYNSFWVSFLNVYSDNILVFKVNLFISLFVLFLVLNYIFIYVLAFLLKMKGANIYLSIFSFLFAFITYFLAQNFLTNQLFLRFKITLFIVFLAVVSFVLFVIAMFSLWENLKSFYSNKLANTKLKIYLPVAFILICVLGFWGYSSSYALKTHICRYYTTERIVLFGYRMFNGNIFSELIPPKISSINQKERDLSHLKQQLNRKPNIILIVIDALRKDVVAENLNKPENVIGQFAKHSCVFENFYSHTTYTVGSISSLFSSKILASRSDLDYLTLAGLLFENGYYTYATNTFIKDFNFDYITLNNIRYDAIFSKGFQQIDKVPFSMKEAKSLKDDKVVRQFNSFLKKYKDDKPIFAYIHFTEMHSIQPSILFKNIFNGKNFYKTYNKIYQSENENMGKLIKVIKDHNLYDNSIIIITTDHGEAAKDHGNLFHVNSLYQELVNIPFYIKLPGQTEPCVVKENFSLIDLFPAMLDYLGYNYSNLEFDGRSFISAINNEKTKKKPVIIAEYVYKYPLAFEYGLYGNDDMYDKAIFEVGVVDENNEWKVIKNFYYDFIELYNLKNDPEEKNNLIDEQQQIAEDLLQKYNNPYF